MKRNRDMDKENFKEEFHTLVNLDGKEWEVETNEDTQLSEESNLIYEKEDEETKLKSKAKSSNKHRWMISVLVVLIVTVATFFTANWYKHSSQELELNSDETYAEDAVLDNSDEENDADYITGEKQKEANNKHSETENQRVLNTDFALYIKDDNLFLTAFPTGKTIQLTKDFKNLSHYASVIEMYVSITQNKDKIYYLDEVKEIDNSCIGTMYCRDLKNLDKTPIKIRENVSLFYSLYDGSLAYYVGKDLERTLYWTDLNKTEKIGDKVYDFRYSVKHKTFFYSDGTLYCKRLGSEAEKIHDNVWGFNLIDNGESCYFTVLEAGSELISELITIYKKTIGKDVVKIDSNVDCDQFMYRKVFGEDGCGYYNKGEVWYYYNGKTSKLISETGMKHTETNEITTMLYTESSKVYIALGDKNLDITSVVGGYSDNCYYNLKVRKNGAIYTFNIMKENYETENNELYTCSYDAEKNSLTKCSLLLDNICRFDFSLGGEKYFLSCKNLKDDLWKDDGIQDQWSATPARTGDIYLTGELISKAVNIYRVHFDEETQTVCYFTDWDTSTRSGTLKIYSGGKEKVLAKNVSFFQFTDSGNVIYLKDGILYMYSNGKTTELAESVSSLPGYYHGHCCVSFM